MKRNESLVDFKERLRAAEDIDNSYFVEAGAGTGKTTLLVERFLSIIGGGRARCGRVVAITFTEKAAGEMKFRLRAEIEKKLRDGALGAEVRERFEAARNELERAPISTIHSFVASVLKEYALEAEIDPGFSILDAVGGAMLLDESWNDFLHGVSHRWSGTLRRYLLLGGYHEQLRTLAYELYERRGERFVEGVFDWGKAKAPDRKPGAKPLGSNSREQVIATLTQALMEAAENLSSLRDKHCIDSEDPGCKEIAAFVREVAYARRLEGEELEDFVLTVPLPKKAGRKSNWSPPDACARQKEIVTDLRALVATQRTCYTDWLSDELSQWLEEFLAFVERRKNRESVLDFDDLLIRTRVLLRSDSALRVLRRRYRYILVDEFQDTDPLQAEIVLLLSGSPEETDSLEPEPGKLFIVGDPKQSIYRFRKADVEVYERVKEWFSEAGTHVRISQNFRSVPSITQWVNAAFSEIIVPPEEGRYQPKYEPIHPMRKGTESAVVLLDLETDDTDIKSDEVRRLEGEAIARLIRHLAREGRLVMDTVTKDMRPLKYSDIAVIYPGTTGINFFEDPLRSEGIPYIVEGGKLYYTRQEIRDLASVLWAIEDPYDSLALFAALRSPLFGFSDEEIFLFTRSGGGLNYIQPGSSDRRRFGAVLDCLDMLADLHRGRNERGSAVTVRELLRRTNFLEIAVLRRHGEQRVLNIHKALQSARDFDARMNTYRRFARWFKDQEMLAVSEGESPLVEEDENAVRLLTVHKSKGLQFPVVILANLVQRRRAPGRILVKGGKRLVFKIGRLMETSDYEELSENEKLREAAELVRLLYVAATRAGDLLVIPKTPRPGGYYDIIAGHLAGNGGEGETSTGTREANDTSGMAAAEVSRLTLSDLPRLKGAVKPFVSIPRNRKKVEAETMARREEWLSSRRQVLAKGARAPAVLTPSGVERAAGQSHRGAVEVPEGIERDERALRFGIAFHRIMELVDLRSRTRLRDLVEIVAIEHGLHDEAGELANLTERALSSSLIKSVAGAPRVYREVPFALAVNERALEGRIDLLFNLDGAWTAVDYKTDNISRDEVDERFEAYRLQGGLYAMALSRLGVPCSGGVVFYFVRSGETRLLTVSDDVARNAERLIHDADL